MYFHYGLIQAITESLGINYSQYNALKVQKIFGMMDSDLNPADIGLVQPLSALITSLLKDCEWPTTPSLIWDLNPSCDVYLCNDKQRHPNIHVEWVMLNCKLWYHIWYDKAVEVQCWWDLLVNMATTAVELYCCTMQSLASAMNFLVNQSIPFHTVFQSERCDPVISLLPPIQTVLGWCSSDFAPTFWDYKEYECHVYVPISQPKGCAALLHGGIVWHLAIEVLLGDWHELAKRGPLANIYSYGQAFMPKHGEPYYDDVLSSDELDVICSIYKVCTASM